MSQVKASGRGAFSKGHSYEGGLGRFARANQGQIGSVAQFQGGTPKDPPLAQPAGPL
jgi:hypothetical protein